MRLKKLELFGFKSFAERTEVLFDEGVTCVVGPNGCGKSNISDAIRWVLGERSAKLLRGSKMEDVIFNGTDFRKPLAFAEVSLTIDNTDRGLPIDYQEVTIARRLYRSGESEYLINRTACRLKDIQDLILDTGIGSSAYSMIEQGRIDYILNADAEERRFLIEEAAGISKYKVKKDEAIRKLERTEENLLRLNDIVQEVYKNIQYAERQAKRAEKYKIQFEELKKLEIQKAFYDLGELSREKSSREEVFRETSLKRTGLESDQAGYERKSEELISDFREIAGRFSKEEQKFYGLKLRLDQNDQQLRFNQEKRVELAERRGENQLENSQIKERLQQSAAEIKAKQKDFEDFENGKQSVLENLRSSEVLLNQIERALELAKSERDLGKGHLFQVTAETLKIKNEYHRLTAWLETSEEQKRRVLVNLDRFRSEKEQWHAKGQGYLHELGILEQKISELRFKQEHQEEHAKQLKIQIGVQQKESEKTEHALQEAQIRLQMLMEIDLSQEKEQTEMIFQSGSLGRNLFRSLREVITVQKGYELALEAALGDLAESWVVEHFETAEKIVEILNGKKSPGLTVLVREEGKGRQGSPQKEKPELALIECSLTDVVSIEPSYVPLLMPLIENFYVLRALNPSDLRPLAAFCGDFYFVTKQGACLGAFGKISFLAAESFERNPFQRNNEIRELKETVARLNEEKSRFIHLDHELKDQWSLCETDLQKMKADEIDLKIAKEAQESFRTGLDDRLNSYNQELSLLTQELEEIDDQARKAQEQKQKLEQDLALWTEREKEAQEKQDALLHKIEKMEYDRSHALEEMTELRTRFQHLEERERLLKEALGLLTDHEARDRKRLEYLAEDFLRMTEKEKFLQDSDSALTLSQQELQSELRQVEVSLEVIRQEQNQKEAETAKIEKLLQGNLKEQQDLQTMLHEIEMKMMDLGYQEKALVEKIEQAYHVKLSELKAEEYSLKGFAVEEVEAFIQKLRERVESLGTVNLLAIEEYEESKKRYDFLIAQQKDMQDARESLLEAIRKINRTTKTLFEETFANVQKMFEEYYKILFQGGEARLVLIDETHPLESGIDIIVRPPGKKLQHITLLSGGEKALTAIALLFALFKIKPSPFCVLDEVDAPLDEANIDRFLAVLRTFLDHSQFIIVTHNRKTIAMGDTLYGITMQEAGVSKIVSVKMHPEETSSFYPTGEGEPTPIEEPVSA